MSHKLVPLDCHRCNITKWAIQTFKYHFVSILSGVDDRFPISLWSHLVWPAELTVNLLWQSNVAPKVSAYTHVHEQHNYMKHPFAPLGCTVMSQDKPKNRQSWDIHADTGFNIVTMMEHHQCFHIYIVKKRTMRISDTVFFKHYYITNPQVTSKTLAIKAALDLISAFTRNSLTWWHNGRGTPKVQQVIHKDSRGKIRAGKGKRAIKQPSKSPQCPPSCTTSKGGQETIYPSKPTSKGTDRYCGGWLSSHYNAYTNCWRRDTMTEDTMTTQHKAKLHFAGQRRQRTKQQVQHKVTNNQYYARGNACMHQYHQAKIWDFSSQTGYQKIPVDTSLQNGKLCSW